jgi:hypothetical protein
VTNSLKQHLFNHFSTWQHQQGEIRTVKEFAQYVGVDYKILDHLFNERRGLSESVAEKLAKALNDLQFYDFANLPRPDPITFYIERSLYKLDDEGKRQVANEIARHITERPPNNSHSH